LDFNRKVRQVKKAKGAKEKQFLSATFAKPQRTWRLKEMVKGKRFNFNHKRKVKSSKEKPNISVWLSPDRGHPNPLFLNAIMYLF